MTGQQRTVLWIGLILIGLNLVSQWKAIGAVIFSGAGIGAGIPGSNESPNPSPGGLQIPDPLKQLLPGAPLPGTITIGKTTKKPKVTVV